MTDCNGPLGQLVSFEGAGGLRLDGILYRAPRAKITVVHAHGSFGNFYQNVFVRVLAAEVQRAGANFFTFNLSAHDGVAEGYFSDGRFEYVGASMVGFDTCLEDLRGAVRFAEGFSSDVVLSGHSLGCDRVVASSLHHGWRYPLVLLAPCDSYALQANLRAPETVELQRERLRLEETAPRSGNARESFDWLPLSEYGVRSSAEWTYPNPITRNAFLSISAGAPYRLFRFDSEPTWHLGCRGLVVTPGSDALLTAKSAAVGDFFANALSNCRHLVIPGDHMFAGSEEQLAGHVSRWLGEFDEERL